jgi:diguanylate cyclase (GGDEF)-like protein
LAKERPGVVVWSDPYRFFTTQELGVTGSVGWYDAQGRFWAVGLDTRLNEWQQEVTKLAVQLGGRIVLTDRNGVVVADSARGSAPPSAVGERVALDFSEAPWQQLRDKAGRVQLVMAANRPQLGTMMPLPFPGLDWRLWLLVPVTKPMADWPQWVAGFALALMGSLLLVWLLSVRWGRRMAKPVESLTAVAEAIGRQRFDVRVPRQQQVAELRRLAQTLDGLRRRLRVVIARLVRQRQEIAQQLRALQAAEERLTYVALHDSLTDLPNRRLFLEVVRQALTHAARDQGRLAIVLINLDRFKELNDTFGHEAGDALLVAIAMRLRQGVRRSDLVARMGGDEFAVLLDGLGCDEAQRLAEALLRQLIDEPYPVAEQGKWHLSASIGLACFPDHGLEPKVLLRAADMAMYWAKASGRNHVVRYEPDRDREYQERSWVRAALEGAWERGEMRLCWQPQVDLQSGAVVSAEALLRWDHPLRGPISPGVFIPVAEGSGLIVPLGAWVLQQAITEAKVLIASGVPLQRIAVNISAVQLAQSDFAEQVSTLLRALAFAPSQLELELTESMMADLAMARQRLSELERLGVRLAIDDFGTGYSSLAYLQVLPFDLLKIDRMFVQPLAVSPATRALLESFVQIARSFAMETVAEGVETAEQVTELRSVGVTLAQGFYFARPMPAAELVAWWQERSAIPAS